MIDTGATALPARRDAAAAAIALTGWAAHVPAPGLDRVLGLALEPACPAESAHELLGRRGLLGKDEATRLGLCAVHRALRLPAAGPRPAGAPDPRTAVVASSNFGNVATVHRVARAIETGGPRAVSALDAPNASSNVLASSIAIWFRFGGPNLMVCSGATSGLDAVALARLLLRARRADRVVVVGAEPGDEVSSMLYARRRGPPRGARLRAGAAALVLARADAHGGRGLVVGPVESGANPERSSTASRTPLVIGPAGVSCGDTRVVDLAGSIGDTYGALGVLQVAVAAHLLRAAPAAQRAAVVCGDPIDGWRSTIVGIPPASGTE